MSFAEIAEQPRHTIAAARAGPAVELTRWLFERSRVSYHERGPILRMLAAWRHSGDGLVVVGSEGAWNGAREVLDRLDAKSRPGQRLYGESEADRTSNRALIAKLLDLLPGRDHSPDPGVEAAAPFRAACDLVEAELERRGTPFVGGAAAGIVDIVFAALMAPAVYPPRYGVTLPPLDRLPAGTRSFVVEMRARRAGALVLETYATARPDPQGPMRARGCGRGLLSLVLGAGPQRLAARLAAAYGHVVRIKRFALAIRWSDVDEILRRDLDFRIAPVNGPRIEEVNGPFVLGLDRGSRMAAERPQLYAAVSAIDLDAVCSLVSREAERLLDDAVAAHGRLDIVNGYARLVAARTARTIFGIAGPTEMDLMRVIRAVFNHTFLNLFGDQEARRRAIAAALELKQWFEDEIARRHAQGNTIDDVIGRLLRLRPGNPDALDDDGVRRNVAGLLVGAIDTTATCVGKIVAMAAADRALLERIERDLDDAERMAGWCRELLRLWTHNPFLLRQTEAEVSLGNVTIPAGSTVVALTQAAMFDPSRFPDPGRLDPTRSPKLYRHFGGGLHPCAGRAVNDVQIPELVRRVIKRGIARVERPRYDGFFIDKVVVSFRGSVR